MREESREEDLTIEGFRKFLDYLAPAAYSLASNAPLGEELLQRYRAVTLETDSYADQFFGEDLKGFMQTLAHNVAARHPDRFMEHSPLQWASAIESFLFARFIDDIHPQSKRRAMLGACRYVAPGVIDLMEQIDGLLPQSPGPPDDPEITAWMEAVTFGERRAVDGAGEPDAGEPDEDVDIDDADDAAGGVEDLEDPGDSMIPGEARGYYHRIIHYTDQLGEFIGVADVVELMRHFARLAVVYGSAESRAIPPEDVALFIEVMTLEVLAGPPGEREPSEFAEIEAGLRRGNEELLKTLRVSVGRDAIVRGFEAQGYEPPDVF